MDWQSGIKKKIMLPTFKDNESDCIIQVMQRFSCVGTVAILVQHYCSYPHKKEMHRMENGRGFVGFGRDCNSALRDCFYIIDRY